MENIGKFLLEKRQAKGLSLDEISAKTKLHPNIIKSIERDDFSNLGGTGYTRIIITTYGKVLGLSQSEIDNLMSKAPKQEHCIPRQPKEVLNPPTILIHKNLILFVLLLILIAILTYTVVKLYQSEKLTFPFRTRGASEEIIDEPLPDLELEEDYLDESGVIEPLLDDTDDAEIEARAIEDEEKLFTTTEDEQEIKFSYITDCNDYLSEYMILSTIHNISTEDDLFDLYIRSF